jgi:CBS domain-containing protein
MKLSDLMTSSVVSVTADTTLQEAAEKMRAEDVGVLPVCEGDRLVGIITDRDLTVRGLADGRDPASSTVRETMTTDLVTCYGDEDAAEAERVMQERRVRRIAVLDREQRLIGVVSLGDLATKNDERCGVARTLELISEPTS